MTLYVLLGVWFESDLHIVDNSFIAAGDSIEVLNNSATLTRLHEDGKTLKIHIEGRDPAWGNLGYDGMSEYTHRIIKTELISRELDSYPKISFKQLKEFLDGLRLEDFWRRIEVVLNTLRAGKLGLIPGCRGSRGPSCDQCCVSDALHILGDFESILRELKSELKKSESYLSNIDDYRTSMYVPNVGDCRKLLDTLPTLYMDIVGMEIKVNMYRNNLVKGIVGLEGTVGLPCMSKDYSAIIDCIADRVSRLKSEIQELGKLVGLSTPRYPRCRNSTGRIPMFGIL